MQLVSTHQLLFVRERPRDRNEMSRILRAFRFAGYSDYFPWRSRCGFFYSNKRIFMFLSTDKFKMIFLVKVGVDG